MCRLKILQITIPENSSRCFDSASVPVQRLRTTTLSSSAIMSSMVTRKSGNFFERGADVRYDACRSRKPSRRDVGPVIDKAGCEIHCTDVHVFSVHEFLKM